MDDATGEGADLGRRGGSVVSLLAFHLSLCETSDCTYRSLFFFDLRWSGGIPAVEMRSQGYEKGTSQRPTPTLLQRLEAE